MKKLYLPFIFALSCANSIGQSKEFFKTWISTAELRIQNVEVVQIVDEFEDIEDYQTGSEDTTSQTSEVESEYLPEIDTSFYKVDLIMDIKSNGKIYYKRIGGSIKELQWTKSSENELTTYLMDKKLSVVLDSTNHLSLVLFKELPRIKKVLFEPIEDVTFPISLENFKSTLTNYSWTVISLDSLLEFQPYHMRFNIDLINISYLDTDSIAYINKNLWTIDSYKNHRFIVGEGGFDPYTYHITNFISKGDSLILKGDQYIIKGFPFESKYPELNRLKFIGSKLLSDLELDSIGEQIIGTWEAISNPFPAESYFKEEYLDYNLTYRFNNDGILIKTYGGKVSDSHGTWNINETDTLTWQLDKTGQLLLLDNFDFPLMLSIHNNILKVKKKMRSLRSHYVNNMSFEMKKVVD